VIEPALVRTKLRSNCRIFQQKDITEIITELLTESGNKNVTFDTHDSHDPREYCVQYRETDFDFIKRLAAEEGLVYSFEHTKDQHQLIFSDQLHHGPVKAELIYNPKPSAQQPEPALRQFDYTEQLKTDEHRMRDYSFTHPRYNLEHSHHGQNNLHSKADKQAQYQKFDYPGRYKEDAQGAPFNRYRLEYERRDSQQVSAEGDDMRPQPGHVIALNQYDNMRFTGNWLVTGVEHTGQQPQSQGEDSASSESGSRYHSTLALIPHGQAWRAKPHHKPCIDGAHIAHVVGPAGEEIYCDEYGRVKVQFPWDRYGSRDEHSSCWIRVSQDLGGGAWGHMAIPRIGHEVIVDFLEGDPDQPIITGRTYHANNMPPYALPQHKTRTTIKSQTHKGVGYNELRFEDEAKQEEIFIHAQKDENNIVQNDETTRVGHDRTEDIGNDRTEDVLNDETLSVTQDQRETIGRDRFQFIERNRTTRIDKDFIEKVNNHRVESTHANHYEEVGGHYVHTVNGNYSLEVIDTITSQTTKHLSTASEKMVIQGPGGSITIDSGGVTFKANQINIHAGSVAFNGGSPGGVPVPNFDINEGEALDEIIDPQPLELELKSDLGHPIPEAYYQVVFEDGSTRSGLLDKEGKNTIPSVPKDMSYSISYPDDNDVRVKALAYQFRDIIDGRNIKQLLALLREPRDDLLGAQRMYQRYLDQDLVDDILTVITQEEQRTLAQYLMTHAELIDGGLEFDPRAEL